MSEPYDSRNLEACTPLLAELAARTEDDMSHTKQPIKDPAEIHVTSDSERNNQ